MNRSIIALVALVLGFFGAGCTVQSTLDSHGDQHLWYAVYKTDSQGVVDWAARMTATDRPLCSAATQTDKRDYPGCGISEIFGKAENVAAATAVIKKHFDQFVANNNLRPADQRLPPRRGHNAKVTKVFPGSVNFYEIVYTYGSANYESDTYLAVGETNLKKDDVVECELTGHIFTATNHKGSMVVCR